LLLGFVPALSGLVAQEKDQSLGDLARKERERKQARAGGSQGTTEVANRAVGVRLAIPQGWKAREIPDPVRPHLIIDCFPDQPNSCWLMVKSRPVRVSDTAITDADRRIWDAAKHPRHRTPARLVSSRDLRVAGYPAHEVIVQNVNEPQERIRTVYVLAHDVRRLFEFSFSASWGSEDHFDEYEPAFEAALKSFSPLARAAPELSEQAIPESLRASARQAGDATLDLRTTAFKPGGHIPEKFTCDGPDVSPALSWSAPPVGTKSFALIADDPDAPAGTWVHWVAYDLPPELNHLPEGLAKHEAIREGGRQGQNDFGKIGYGGPCPPRGKAHRYFFKLYALDTMLDLKSGATKQDVEQAMKGHILNRAELSGRFGH